MDRFESTYPEDLLRNRDDWLTSIEMVTRIHGLIKNGGILRRIRGRHA